MKIGVFREKGTLLFKNLSLFFENRSSFRKGEFVLKMRVGFFEKGAFFSKMGFF